MPEVSCKICGKKFYAKPSWLKIGHGKHCSRECQYKSQLRGRFVHCNVCGKETWRPPKQLTNSKSGKFFCSKSHQTLWRNQVYSGSNHPLWKGGNHQEYRTFLLRSGAPQKCRLCGCEDKRVLIAHHLDGKRNNNIIKNLIWLCFNCHHLVHYYKDKVKIK
ncbi:MAG: HNH endonuclease signature motif containing protein [bacterium]|nr:HNH endonuclease signature motif containing protein [bacterium]